MKPKILFYSDCPVFGGADAVAAAILRDELLRGQADLTFAYRDHPRFAEGVDRQAPDARRLPVPLPERHDWLTETTPLPLKLVFRLADYFVFLYDLARLACAFRGASPDLVHVNDGGYPGSMGCRAAAVAARLAGAKRVVFVVHNQALPRRMPWELLDWAIDALVSASVDVFITASATSQESLARRGFPQGRMRIIPDGVPAPGPRRDPAEVRAELGLPRDEPVFVMTAFFEPRKGHKTLINAMARLGQAAPRLLLVGDGPERSAVERQAAQAGLSGRLTFAGFRGDYLDLIAACDALLLPSIGNEDMPLVILDAMALGKTVVASRLAGIPEEVADGVTGLLVEPGDSASLAEALRHLADPELRDRCGKAGRERFSQNFESGILAGRYRRLYAGLLGRSADAESVV